MSLADGRFSKFEQSYLALVPKLHYRLCIFPRYCWGKSTQVLIQRTERNASVPKYSSKFFDAGLATLEIGALDLAVHLKTVPFTLMHFQNLIIHDVATVSTERDL